MMEHPHLVHLLVAVAAVVVGVVGEDGVDKGRTQSTHPTPHLKQKKQDPASQDLASLMELVRVCPTSNGGAQNGSPVRIRTCCICGVFFCRFGCRLAFSVGT